MPGWDGMERMKRGRYEDRVGLNWEVWKRVRDEGERNLHTVANCCNGRMKSPPPFLRASATYSSPTTSFLISKPLA